MIDCGHLVKFKMTMYSKLCFVSILVASYCSYITSNHLFFCAHLVHMLLQSFTTKCSNLAYSKPYLISLSDVHLTFSPNEPISSLYHKAHKETYEICCDRSGGKNFIILLWVFMHVQLTYIKPTWSTIHGNPKYKSYDHAFSFKQVTTTFY